MLSLFVAALLHTAAAAEMPVCQDISTDTASFEQVYEIQNQVADMTTGFHCRGDRGERVSGWPSEPEDFLSQCGNSLFAGETCYTGDQTEALELLNKLAEKGALGPSHSLRDVKKKGDLITYSIQDKKGGVAPQYDRLAAGRCRQSSFEP